MKATNAVLIGLLSLTLLMQGAILFKQSRGAAGSQRTPPGAVDAPKGYSLGLEGHPARGRLDAKVVLVEFSDYECPFCQRHTNGVGKQINEKYVASGQLRHVFVNNPLPIHPEARLLATAALCAGDQNRYWEMHDLLFSTQIKTNDEVMATSAKLSLDSDQFQKCLSRDAIAKQIDQDIEIAKGLQLSGTPSFALGRLDASGRLKPQRIITGAQPLEVFEKEIGAALSN